VQAWPACLPCACQRHAGRLFPACLLCMTALHTHMYCQALCLLFACRPCLMSCGPWRRRCWRWFES
jgi:hypothetical protein